MFAPERKFRVFVVIEGDFLPSPRRMAFLAFCPVPALVLIVEFVTPVAGLLEFFAI